MPQDPPEDRNSAFKRFGDHISCRCRVDYKYKCNYCKYACCSKCTVGTCVCRIRLTACKECAEKKEALAFGGGRGFPLMFHPYLCVGSHS